MWHVASRKAIKGVLDNFLGTYTSRYSDHNGYWLFGFLVEDHEHLHIDLLSDDASTQKNTPETVAIELARLKFRDQVAKAGLTLDNIRAATLVIVRLPGMQKGWHAGNWRDGYQMNFSASATMDNGPVNMRQKAVFVAPHDASIEQRSARARN